MKKWRFRVIEWLNCPRLGSSGSRLWSYAACLLGSGLGTNTLGTKRMATGVGRRKSWAVMQATDGLTQTMGNSGATMALQSCLKLRQDGQVFILPLNRVLDMGSLRRVDFGWGGSAAEADPKGVDSCWPHFQHLKQQVLHWHRNWVVHPRVQNVKKVPPTWVVRADLEQTLNPSN